MNIYVGAEGEGGYGGVELPTMLYKGKAGVFICCSSLAWHV